MRVLAEALISKLDIMPSRKSITASSCSLRGIGSLSSGACLVFLVLLFLLLLLFLLFLLFLGADLLLFWDLLLFFERFRLLFVVFEGRSAGFTRALTLASVFLSPKSLFSSLVTTSNSASSRATPS